MSSSQTYRHLTDSTAAFSKVWATLEEGIWCMLLLNIHSIQYSFALVILIQRMVQSGEKR